jgi:hypothetical protein
MNNTILSSISLGLKTIGSYRLILILIPMFLIISSSGYHTIISGIQNKEMSPIKEASAKLHQAEDDDDVVHVTWTGIFYKRISSSYDPSSPTRTLDGRDNVGGLFSPRSGDVTISGNTLHAAYGSGSAITHIKSEDDGATFGKITSLCTLCTVPGDASDPSVAASGEHVYVVWAQDRHQIGDDIFFDEIGYARSIDGGDSFADSTVLDTASGQDELILGPSIAASSDSIHIVWWKGSQESGIGNILYKKSIDGGDTFGNTIVLGTGPMFGGQDIAVGRMGAIVHVVWSSTNPDGTTDIYHRRSIDGGISFGGIMNVSNNPEASFSPAISGAGNYVHVVWTNQVGASTAPLFDIYYTRSTNNGIAFGDTMNLSNNPGESLSPAIAVSGDNIYVVWSNLLLGPVHREGDDLVTHILYVRSTNRGASFDPTLSNLSNDIDIAFPPSPTGLILPSIAAH